VSPATTRRREKARDHRASVEAAIFAAVETLLADRPFRDLTVEDVMAATGMGRTAFYRYFPDLETVLLRRLSQVDDMLTDAADNWLLPQSDPSAGLDAAASALATVFRDHAPLLRALADATAGSPDLDNAWRATVAGFIGPATERITALCENGDCKLEQPDDTARALVWMTEHYLLETYREEIDFPPERAARNLALIWRRTLFGSDD
jgi:TetR/AcrR family transcriptional regulator, ethionamide resistance regulator